MAVLLPSLLFILGLVTTVRGYLDIYPPVDENDTRTPLYFALLQSFGSVLNGSGSVAGLQVALDRINSDPTLLPGYSLHYTLTDSQVRHNQLIYTSCKFSLACTSLQLAAIAYHSHSNKFNQCCNEQVHGAMNAYTSIIEI